MHDVIVVGSGASGAWAAFAAARRGLRVLVLDVGLEPPAGAPLRENLYALRKRDPEQRAYLLGERFESLHNLHAPNLSSRLKAPRFRYVTDHADRWAPLEGRGFSAVQSFALGGLAAAWGAGAYRFTDEDLDGFPIGAADLAPYYDELTRLIGIAGCADDLPYGSAAGLQEPLRPGKSAQRLLASYRRRRELMRARGLSIGHPRAAILSRPLGERESCRYDNLSFWQPELPAVYSPTMTMRGLIAERRIDYRPRRLVEGFAENAGSVTVTARDPDGGPSETFDTRALVLAAGTLNSARIVLRSFRDERTRLPLLENAMTWTPFVDLARVGAAVDAQSHGLVQLNMTYRPSAPGPLLHGSFFSYTSPLAGDVWADFPFSASGNAACCKYLLPALMILQLNHPDRPAPGNDLQLAEGGRLIARRAAPPPSGREEREIIAALRRLGFLSHPALVKTAPAGAAIHYAGTLPMSEDASLRYRTDRAGKLSTAERVYVADAAAFPFLPAKHHTLTIMANAMRVADGVADRLGARA